MDVPSKSKKYYLLKVLELHWYQTIWFLGLASLWLRSMLVLAVVDQELEAASNCQSDIKTLNFVDVLNIILYPITCTCIFV